MKINKVEIDWEHGDVTFYLDGSGDEPFSSREFVGETKKKMREIEEQLNYVWFYNRRKNKRGRKR